MPCRMRAWAMGRLNVGIKQINPMPSVKNPGVNNRAPPINSIAPSNSSVPGSSPLASLDCNLARVSNPCWRSRVIPITAVNMTRPTVGIAPIILPTLIKRIISMIGMLMNRTNSIRIDTDMMSIIPISSPSGSFLPQTTHSSRHLKAQVDG